MYRVMRCLLSVALRVPWALSLSLWLLLSACSDQAPDGLKVIDWAHDVCERCGMLLKDRNSVVQILYRPEPNQATRIALFDDFGCAVLWLEDKPWRTDPATEIWVKDQLTGESIDGHSAGYITGQLTPMHYGLSARKHRQTGDLTFSEAKQRVQRQEQRLNDQGRRLLEKYHQRATRRDGALDQVIQRVE